MAANATIPALLRLLQITSPSLPVGGYSYSQGLEWAVQVGWVSNAEQFTRWLNEQLDGVLSRQDLPLLIRTYEAACRGDLSEIQYWDAIAIAMRETAELRFEEVQRGRALTAVLRTLSAAGVDLQSQISVYAMFCAAEQIAADHSLAGYAYSWLDSQVTAAVKLVPLGQSEGIKILYSVSELIPTAISYATQVEDDDIGYTSPALTMASCFHETQYSRLFRS